MSAGSLAFGYLLGLSIAVPPGPVNALIARDTMRVSRKAGILIGCGAMTSDSVFLILIYSLGTALQPSAEILRFLFLISGLALLVLGALVVRSLVQGRSAPEPKKALHPLPYVAGLLVGLTNPYQWLWWSSVGLASLQSIGWVFAVGFLGGIATWIVTFPVALELSGRRFQSLYSAVLAFSAVTLLVFGGYFLYRGF